MRDSSADAIVIGAGLAGLAAGVRLRDAGWSVRLLERQPFPGGRILGKSLGRELVDTGAQYVSCLYSFTLDLIDYCGLHDDLLELPKWAAYWHPGRISAARILSILDPNLHSWQAAYALTRRFLHVRKFVLRRDLSIIDLWGQLSDSCNLESLLLSTGGSLSELVMAIGRAFYFDDSSALFQIRNVDFPFAYFLNRTVYTLKCDGLGGWLRQLADPLAIDYSIRVHSVEKKGERVCVTTDKGVFWSPRVVIAVPGPVARMIYYSPDEQEISLTSVRYSSTIVAVISVEGESRLLLEIGRYFGVAVSHQISEMIAAISYSMPDSSGGSRAGSRGILSVFLSGKSARVLWSVGEGDLLARLFVELGRLIPGFETFVRDARLSRWRYAIPEFSAERIRVIQDYRVSRRRGENVYLAGDYASIPCIEGAAESGRWAATMALDSGAELM